MNFRFKKEKQRLKNSFKTLFRLHDLWVNKSEKTQISDFQKKSQSIFLSKVLFLTFFGIVRPCVNITVFGLRCVVPVKQSVEIISVKNESALVL